MSERDRRRTLGWIAALLLVAAAAWLVFGQDDGGARTGDLDDVLLQRDAREESLLTTTGETDAEVPVAVGPELVGRAEDPDDALTRGPVRVQVLGAGDHPLAGVVVEALPTLKVQLSQAEDKQQAATDLAGYVVFGDLPYDGSHSVRLRKGGTTGNVYSFVRKQDGTFTIQVGGPPIAKEEVRGPEIVLRTDAGLALRIDVVSAIRGRRVSGVLPTVKPAFAPAPSAERFTSRDGAPVPVRHGEDTRLEVAVAHVPDDFVLHDERQWQFRAHPEARRLVGRMPLRPEAQVFVSFEEPEGVPAGVRWKPKCRLGKQWLQGRRLRVEADAYGRRRLCGVPHIPGEPVRIAGRYGDWGVSAHGRLPLDPDEPLHLEAGLSRIPRAELAIKQLQSANFLFGGTVVTGKGGLVQLRSVSNVQLDLSSFIHQRLMLDPRGGAVTPVKPPKPAQFDVRVLRPDGKPACGAQVNMTMRKDSSRGVTKTVSRKGVARFEKLPPGDYVAKVWGAGASFREYVTVPEAGEGEITVRRRVGGEVQLEVIDADENPIPHARITVRQPSGLPWCDIDEHGEQRIDPFTDHEGCRRLRNVEPGDVKITATLGSRSKGVVFEVRGRGTTRAVIVFDWPKDDAPAK